jgi:4-hydroxy-tetrahydrodipicolinate synthase
MTKVPAPASSPALPRRQFLHALGTGALGLALAVRGAKAQGDMAAQPVPRQKPRELKGLFPIAGSPFTPDDKLDLDSLAAQITFCNRGGVHGLMWPQLASNWAALREEERLAGAEALIATAKGGNAAVVIGVQGKDMAEVGRYAAHAAKNGADAIISLPPAKVTDEKALLAYYQEVGSLTDLPLFAQATGTMSIDLLVEMTKTIPTMKHVKDEAGIPQDRVRELRRRTNDELIVFSGQGVKTMITEMERGVLGHCPYPSVSDIYAQAYDLWHAGRRQEAFVMFGHILAFDSLGMADQNRIMITRGVFKPDTRFRKNISMSAAAAGPVTRGIKLDDAGVRAALDTYLKPYLRA